MDWYVEDKTVTLGTGAKITFEFPIKSINDCNDQLDIKLEIRHNLDNHNNSFYFSKKNGKITWSGIYQVPKTTFCSKIKDKSSEQLPNAWGKEKNTLIIEKNKQVSFDYPIKAILKSSGILVVLLNVPMNQSMTENVFGVSQNGTIIWQIEKIPEISINTDNYYTGINESISRGIIACYNWCGMNVFIDIETGIIVETEFTK